MKYGATNIQESQSGLISTRDITYVKGKPRIPPESSDPVSAFVACFFKNYGFPLMTALVLMFVMVIIMRMLMAMLLH